MSRLETCLHGFRWVYADYPLESVEVNHQGHNNDVLVVNGALILRFPRYSQGIEDLKVETAILGAIRSYLNLEIPNPQFVHLEGQLPGQAFVGYPRIPGVPLQCARFYQATFALTEALFGIENNDLQAFESRIEAYR
jgi:aminoglycoside 2''-phosphotransferase